VLTGKHDENCIEMLKKHNYSAKYFELVPKDFIDSQLVDSMVEYYKIMTITKKYNYDMILKYIPHELQSYELAKLVLSKIYGGNFVYLRPDLQTNSELANIAVMNSPYFLDRGGYSKNIWTLLTEDTIIYYLSQPGKLLYRIPTEVITPNICLSVSKMSIYNFDYIPKKYLTTEIIYNLLVAGAEKYIIYGTKGRNYTNKIMRYICEEQPDLLTEDILLYYFQNCNCRCVPNIPKHYLTVDFFNKVIGVKPNLIQIVPKDIKTSEYCFELLKINPDVLKYIPKKYLANMN
jgi:hypothetical protein